MIQKHLQNVYNVWAMFTITLMITTHQEKRSLSKSLSKFKWNNNQMFLKIVFIYFLLMCKVLTSKFYLSQLATRLMFHWKAFFILLLLFICSLLLLHGDIESNPGPRYSKNHLPSFSHWNLNSLAVHNFSKMLLLKSSRTTRVF